MSRKIPFVEFCRNIFIPVSGPPLLHLDVDRLLRRLQDDDVNLDEDRGASTPKGLRRRRHRRSAVGHDGDVFGRIFDGQLRQPRLLETRLRRRRMLLRPRQASLEHRLLPLSDPHHPFVNRLLPAAGLVSAVGPASGSGQNRFQKPVLNVSQDFSHRRHQLDPRVGQFRH